MAKRGRKKGSRGVGHTTSLLTTLFAVTPALFILTTAPAGQSQSALGYLLGGGGTWQSLAFAGVALSQMVVQNWVTVLILLAIAYVGIKVVRKLGRRAHITRHLTA